MHSEGEDGYDAPTYSAVITKPSQLGPMRHRDDDDMYRVVLWRDKLDPEYDYMMCVGEGYIRMFTEETLPIDLRLKITAIDSFIEGLIAKGHLDSAINNEKHVFGSQTIVYENQISEELNDIGWRTQDFYCLVLTREELMQYKGRHDSRS
jgi:hypothetical protein